MTESQKGIKMVESSIVDSKESNLSEELDSLLTIGKIKSRLSEEMNPIEIMKMED
jgi:hypothetical protein